LEKQPFTNASVTEILVDDGKPLSVMFGGGVGVEFIRHPYAEWVKEGIEEPWPQQYGVPEADMGY